MFAKKHTSMFGAFAIDSKASRGRHVRVEGRAQSARCAFESSTGRAQSFSGKRASRSACRAIEGPAGQVQAFAGQRVSRPLSFDEGEFLIDGYGAYAPYDQATERYAAEDSLPDEESSETVENASSCEKASSAQLEGMFQEFFRMGAAVAIGELHDEGMLGDKNAVAYDVRDYLESFGIASFDEVCRLGITGPYLEDFKRIFAANASFPPAA
ncbi:MAG: hypothetical protein Q4Q41_08265 [Coriobacteriia bacterium]|nr:hypothetical protein [Coriobacteriia bacterium]